MDKSKDWGGGAKNVSKPGNKVVTEERVKCIH